jgi:hypothetical protein
MFQSLIDDPRLRKELLINWNNPSSIPPYDKDYLDEIHSAEWYHDTYKLYNIQDGTFVVLCGLIFFLDHTHVAGNDRQGIECLFFTLSIIPWQFRNRSWSCLNLRQMIPKDRMPLLFTVSFLSYYEVCERHTHLEVSSQMCWDLMAFNKP